MSAKCHRLCEMIQDRRSSEPLKPIIEESYECSTESLHLGIRSAREHFQKVIFLDENQLEKSKLVLNNKLEQLIKETQELSEGSFARIAKSANDRLPEYRACWEEEEAAEAMKAGRAKRLLNKLFK